MTSATIRELKTLLDKAKNEQGEGLWEATENTTDLMIFLAKHGGEMSRLIELGVRYEASPHPMNSGRPISKRLSVE